MKGEPLTLTSQLTREDVHGRSAEKAGNEQVCGMVIQFEGFRILPDFAALHQNDLLPEGHGLRLVVGDVNQRGAGTGMQTLKFPAKGEPGGGIKVGKRLIEKEDCGLSQQGASQCNPLLLATREFLREPVEPWSEFKPGGHGCDPSLDFTMGNLAGLEAEGEIVTNAHVGVEGCLLEHHGDTPFMGRSAAHGASVDPDLPCIRLLKPGNQTQHSRFAAS